MRLFRPMPASQFLYPEAVFRIKETGGRHLCLTFDDGPDPDSTSFIAGILKNYNIKAIFFCNGRNAEKYPALVKSLKDEGHMIGNHGYEHLDGWRTACLDYINNVNKAAVFTSESLFRPPYGHLTLPEYHKLRTRYRIFFWDIMPYDFDRSFGSANCLRILKNKLRRGSVIVLHDKPGSMAGVILSEFIIHALDEGYDFSVPELFSA